MLLRQATADMQRRVRNVSSLVMGRLVRAAAVEQANKGREHPTDTMLTEMVNDIRAEQLCPTVQQQGVCARECVVLDELSQQSPCCTSSCSAAKTSQCQFLRTVIQVTGINICCRHYIKVSAQVSCLRCLNQQQRYLL
ncbi:hypothetical protein ABBQ32_002137 [Trebouxia sp. C0010 RCD-2024]